MSNISNSISDIDFVVLWVDGNDPEWLEQFNRYANDFDGDKRTSRFRDWDNLKYMFRAFEQCSPWVRKIHFVTWGHLPAWLNTSHPKLSVVKHEDFLPSDILPVFSSHPIELNLHRIPGLAEKFVYFNDDMFLLRPVFDSYFFKHGLPKDMCVFNALYLDSISHIRLNDIEVVDKWFSKHDFILKNIFRVFNFRYGVSQLRTLFLLPWPQMTGFYDPHQPQPFLKSTYEEVWYSNTDILRETSASRFRSKKDVNQYLFRYWQLMKGKFYPRSFSDTKTIPVKDPKDIDIVAAIVKSTKYTMFCINDELGDVPEESFREYKQTIIDALESVLPDSSTFELKTV